MSQSDGLVHHGSVPLWGRWEQAFVAGEYLPPEAEVEVELSSPQGRRVVRPGFWDGGMTWRVRFMPDEPGLWQYRTRCEPGAKGVSDRSGTFACRQAHGSHALLVHGPVRVSDDRRSLVHADGTPYFYLADTAWNGPMLSEAGEWDRYLADRLAKRFSAIQFVTHTPWAAGHSDAEGQVSFTAYDPMPVAPAAFARIDRRIDAINAQGLLAVPVLLWATSKPFAVGGVVREELLVRMARYQVARYGAHHVMWILPGDGIYEGEVLEMWKRIGRAVFAHEDRAPVFIHPTGQHNPYDGLRDERWLDMTGIQSGHQGDDTNWRWLHSGPISAEWQKEPTRPLINLEPCYEAHKIKNAPGDKIFTDYEVRRAVDWSLLIAPPAGVSYGAHGLWSWQRKKALPLNHANAGVALPWFEAMHLPGSDQMAHVRELFTSLAWGQLRPSPELIVSEPFPDEPARKTLAVCSEDGKQAVVYLPAGGEVALDAQRLASGAKANWFDPRTGARQAAEPAEPGRFTAPDGQDWVLVFS